MDFRRSKRLLLKGQSFPIGDEDKPTNPGENEENPCISKRPPKAADLVDAGFSGPTLDSTSDVSLRRSKRLKHLSKLPSGNEAGKDPNPRENHSMSKESPTPKADPVGAVFSTPEILERILAYLDHRDQKHCRSVSKAWNGEVCRLFRKNPVVLSIENDFSTPWWRRTKGPSSFAALMKTGKELELPSPFQHLGLEVNLKYIDSALKTLKQLPLRVIALKFSIDKYDSKMDMEIIQAKAKYGIPLIHHCAPTLKYLTTPSWEYKVTRTKLSLPELKRLTVLFKVYYSSEVLAERVKNQKDFFVKVLAGAPKLEELYIDGESHCSENMPMWQHPPSSYISDFLSVVDLSMIEVLAVQFTANHVDGDDYDDDDEMYDLPDPNLRDLSVVEDTLRSLKAVKLPELKYLQITKQLASNKLWILDLVLEVATQFSESLQEFHTNFPVLRPFKLPFCPDLTNLVFDSEVVFENLDLSNLPSLERIELGGDVYKTNSHRGAPVSTVESLRIKSSNRIRMENYVPWNLDDFFKPLSTWFPNLKTWEWGDSYVESELPGYFRRKKIKNQKIVSPQYELFQFKRTLNSF